MPCPARLARTRRPHVRVPYVWLVVGATAIALVTACDSGAGGARTEGAGPSANGVSEQADGASSGDDGAGAGDNGAGLKYATCMRENGVDVADPDAQSGFVKIPSGVARSQVERAEKVCGKNPTGGAVNSGVTDEVLNDPEVQALRLKYKGCMRENGYTEPTPDANGGVAIVDSPELRAARKACHAEEKSLNDRIKALKEQTTK
ncbi:hypothetical protein ACFZAV_38760 [Streptomyces sp. NPDC008343]|uniref:hypothetical protein n=1 Tax=Streptomyces sp. NPDC008343 TaxID=3364828 RepID=UPI0036E0555E